MAKTAPNESDPKETSEIAPPIASTEVSKPGISQEVIEELSREINNMLSYAAYNGITINTQVNALIQNSNVDDLINAHNLLCENVAPATPKSITYTKELYLNEKGKTFVNKLPLVRNLILLALFFLIVFIGTSLSKGVNNESLDMGVMENHGLSLLLNLGFLASVSGLGVLFYLLKKISAAVKKGTLIPEESIEYIAQIVLGIISGLIISEIITLYDASPEKINLFNKSVLALIGGFSSDAIFSILQGIIDKAKAIFVTPNP